MKLTDAPPSTQSINTPASSSICAFVEGVQASQGPGSSLRAAEVRDRSNYQGQRKSRHWLLSSDRSDGGFESQSHNEPT